MPKLRIHLTMDVQIHEKATELMRLRYFGDLSGFIEQLIREEWERRNGPMKFPAPAEAGMQLNEGAKSTPDPSREKEEPWKNAKQKP